VLLYQGIDLTIDYLEFPSTVKLEELNDIKYFKLPAVKVCIEMPYILDRNKVLSYFNLTEDFDIFSNNLTNKRKHQMDFCYNKKKSQIIDCLFKLDDQLSKDKFLFDLKIFSERFREIKQNYLKFTIKASDYIFCSAEVSNQTISNKYIISNCEKYAEVIETYNDLGVCFIYFSDRKSLINNSFTLKEKDFIEFETTGKTLNNIMFNNRSTGVGFPIFLSIHDSNTFTFPRRKDFIDTQYKGFRQKIKYLRTTVKYLSWPYKSDCNHFDSKHSLIYLIPRLCF